MANADELTKEVSIADGLRLLARQRGTILISTAVGLLLATILALIAPSEYTSTAILMREAKQEVRGGSLAALRGLGLNLGEAQAGLTIEAYPDVLMSHEVRAVILSDSLPVRGGGTTTFLAYAEAATPSSLGRRLRGWLGTNGAEAGAGAERGGIGEDSLAVAYSREEQEAMDLLGQMIAVEADAETGLMTVSVTAQDPMLAAALTGRLIGELRARVQFLLTEKARKDHEFIRERTEEAEAELRRARSLLASFDDRNRGLTSPQLLAERDRLRQDMGFASEVFSQYQSELKQAEIEVQRASPVVTVLDRPVVPLLRSKPRRKVMVLVGGLIGLAFGLLIAFLKDASRSESADRPAQSGRDRPKTSGARRWRGVAKKPAARDEEEDDDEARGA